MAPTAIALVHVLAVVAGHVIGVGAGHDRALCLFPARRAVASRLALLAVMVAYTVGGPTLLFAT